MTIPVKNVAVLGASGYTGSQLVALLYHHPGIGRFSLYVSENSPNSNRKFADLYPRYSEISLIMEPLSSETVKGLGKKNDVVFLATAHDVSHEIVPVLMEQEVKVVDLSGSFRLTRTELYKTYYSFTHLHPGLARNRAYGIPEWHAGQISDSRLVSVAGCYATAAQLALRPLIQDGLLNEAVTPVINGFSGVSGAGRALVTGSLFCEVSMTPYNVFRHRHQPEIEQQCGIPVIFTPHLCPYKRGLMINCTAKLSDHVCPEEVDMAFGNAYRESSFVVFSKDWPKVDDVAGTPYCHLHWEFNADSNHVIVVAVIDNLLKGAASQAVQCFNLMTGIEETCGLLSAPVKHDDGLSPSFSSCGENPL